MEDLKKIVQTTLEAKGVLSKIRAELRSSVFVAIQEEQGEGTSEPAALQELKRSSEGQLALEIVREFLASAGLDYTLAVLLPEARLPSEDIGRDVLAHRLHIAPAATGGGVQLRRPLLLDLLRAHDQERAELLPPNTEKPGAGLQAHDDAAALHPIQPEGLVAGAGTPVLGAGRRQDDAPKKLRSLTAGALGEADQPAPGTSSSLARAPLSTAQPPEAGRLHESSSAEVPEVALTRTPGPGAGLGHLAGEQGEQPRPERLAALPTDLRREGGGGGIPGGSGNLGARTDGGARGGGEGGLANVAARTGRDKADEALVPPVRGPGAGAGGALAAGAGGDAPCIKGDSLQSTPVGVAGAGTAVSGRPGASLGGFSSGSSGGVSVGGLLAASPAAPLSGGGGLSAGSLTKASSGLGSLSGGPGFAGGPSGNAGNAAVCGGGGGTCGAGPGLASGSASGGGTGGAGLGGGPLGGAGVGVGGSGRGGGGGSASLLGDLPPLGTRRSALSSLSGLPALGGEAARASATDSQRNPRHAPASTAGAADGAAFGFPDEGTNDDELRRLKQVGQRLRDMRDPVPEPPDTSDPLPESGAAENHAGALVDEHKPEVPVDKPPSIPAVDAGKAEDDLVFDDDIEEDILSADSYRSDDDFEDGGDSAPSAGAKWRHQSFDHSVENSRLDEGGFDHVEPVQLHP